MKTIEVIDIIKKDIAVSTDDGKLVHDKVLEQLKNGHEVQLSFKGISLIISHFLNISIGLLYQDMEFSKVDNNLKVVGLSSDDLELLNDLVIPTAKKYFANPDNILNINEEL
jgi:uncharacterized protein YpuA (DUF1002 family)